MTRELEGGCQCGAVRYGVSGEPVYAALCHCKDCRKSAGAPAVHWAAFTEAQFRLIAGEPKEYRSSEHASRNFCPTCGTGLFYRNPVVLPGIVDIQAATLDDTTALPPQIHVQTVERVAWMDAADTLPKFERYPSGG